MCKFLLTNFELLFQTALNCLVLLPNVSYERIFSVWEYYLEKVLNKLMFAFILFHNLIKIKFSYNDVLLEKLHPS